jgi:hypothetical protein
VRDKLVKKGARGRDAAGVTRVVLDCKKRGLLRDATLQSGPAGVELGRIAHGRSAAWRRPAPQLPPLRCAPPFRDALPWSPPPLPGSAVAARPAAPNRKRQETEPPVSRRGAHESGRAAKLPATGQAR